MEYEIQTTLHVLRMPWEVCMAVALANAENYRQREEQLEINLQLDKMASLGSLVASFSHEVGNKVGALQGGAV